MVAYSFLGIVCQRPHSLALPYRLNSLARVYLPGYNRDFLTTGWYGAYWKSYGCLADVLCSRHLIHKPESQLHRAMLYQREIQLNWLKMKHFAIFISAFFLNFWFCHFSLCFEHVIPNQDANKSRNMSFPQDRNANFHSALVYITIHNKGGFCWFNSSFPQDSLARQLKSVYIKWSKNWKRKTIWPRWPWAPQQPVKIKPKVMEGGISCNERKSASFLAI